MEAMLDALLGNIFSHTPAGTAYFVTLNKSSGGLAELVVSDTGGGIADESLLERGESGAQSTGLGVDIVRSTATIAGGTAQWNVGTSSGTVVRVILPLLDVAR
jgi:signal transduction histidine kinase